MTATDNYAPILDGDTICDDEAWNTYVTAVTPGQARIALCELKADLRAQRRARVPDAKDKQADREYRSWLRTQARFEGHVNRRLNETQALILATSEPTGNVLRRAMTELVDTIAALSKAIDDTDLEYLLDIHYIVLGNERMTLGEALDSGRFDGKGRS